MVKAGALLPVLFSVVRTSSRAIVSPGVRSSIRTIGDDAAARQSSSLSYYHRAGYFSIAIAMDVDGYLKICYSHLYKKI
jgi:hypothetical protein